MANTGTLPGTTSFHSFTSRPSAEDPPRFSPLQVSGLKTLFPKGLARGTLLEVNGLRSSGRSSFCNSVLTAATTQDEVCAVVDTHNSFNPSSALLAGVRLPRLVWIQCQGKAEHALRATDLLLHAGGFGVVLLDLCETPARVLSRVPLSYWYRFRKAIEHTATVLLSCTDSAQPKGCSHHSLQLESKEALWRGQAPFLLLEELQSSVFSPKLSVARTHSLSIRGEV
jgi:recA bacterial DNA recombination protein